MDFFEEIDDDFGDQLGVGDVIKMLEKSYPGSKKRKKRKKSKMIVFEDEVDEDEYTYLDTMQTDPLPDPLPDPEDLDILHGITREVSEVTGDMLLNEPLEELGKEIASKYKSKAIKAQIPSSTNQKDANLGNSLVPENASKKKSHVAAKKSNLSQSCPTSVDKDAEVGFKTVASNSSVKLSKSSSSKSSLTGKNVEKSTLSSSGKKIQSRKSTSSTSRSTKKKTEVYVPGSYNKEFKFKDKDFPEIR